MRRGIKLFIIGGVILGVLTGCYQGERDSNGDDYGYIDNLSHEEITNQIKTKMKHEMDKIGFSVDLNYYEFSFNTMQTAGVSGTVSMRDKRYAEYGWLTVYRGSFGSKMKNLPIEEDKVATNPIIFVANGYQDYVVGNILNNKVLGNDIEQVLREVDGEILPYRANVEIDSHSNTEFPGTLVSSDAVDNIKNIKTTTFFYHYQSIPEAIYTNYFQNKSNVNFDRQHLFQTMHFLTIVGIYCNKTNEEIEVMKKKIISFYNTQYLKIILTNEK